MPRRDRNPATPAPAADQPFLIAPDAVYRPAHIQRGMGLRKSTIAREVKLGRLKVSKRGGNYYVLGRWLVAWVEGGVVEPRKPRIADGQGAA